MTQRTKKTKYELSGVTDLQANPAVDRNAALKKCRGDGIIYIDENYCIKVMPVDYALAKIKTDKNGQQYFEPFAYYGSIGKCLKEYLHASVHSDLRKNPGISLADAMETVQNTVQRCSSVINVKFPDYDVVRRDDNDTKRVAFK